MISQSGGNPGREENNMKARKINWKKIGVITYDKFQMTDDSVLELNYAYICMENARWNGDKKRAEYISVAVSRIK